MPGDNVAVVCDDAAVIVVVRGITVFELMVCEDENRTLGLGVSAIVGLSELDVDVVLDTSVGSIVVETDPCVYNIMAYLRQDRTFSSPNDQSNSGGAFDRHVDRTHAILV